MHSYPVSSQACRVRLLSKYFPRRLGVHTGSRYYRNTGYWWLRYTVPKSDLVFDTFSFIKVGRNILKLAPKPSELRCQFRRETPQTSHFRKSKVWLHMTASLNGGVCNHCKKFISGKGGNTSNLQPMLSRMATKYLCVQGSSVPSERVFSSAGDILRCERARLDPESRYAHLLEDECTKLNCDGICFLSSGKCWF